MSKSNELGNSRFFPLQLFLFLCTSIISLLRHRWLVWNVGWNLAATPTSPSLPSTTPRSSWRRGTTTTTARGTSSTSTSSIWRITSDAEKASWRHYLAAKNNNHNQILIGVFRFGKPCFSGEERKVPSYVVRRYVQPATMWWIVEGSICTRVPAKPWKIVAKSDIWRSWERRKSLTGETDNEKITTLMRFQERKLTLTYYLTKHFFYSPIRYSVKRQI